MAVIYIYISDGKKDVEGGENSKIGRLSEEIPSWPILETSFVNNVEKEMCLSFFEEGEKSINDICKAISML